MVRISAIFISTCMVLIAGSIGFVVYLRFGFTGAESALVALGVLTALAVYNAIAARKRDRIETSNQLANLARGSDDLARQLAEFGRRLSTVEVRVETTVDRALATAQPLAAEIEELSALVKKSGPVCMLCYERDHSHCHRRWIAEIIQDRDGVKVENLAAPQI